MKAVGFKRALPIEEVESLIDFDAPKPEPGQRDLLVEVRGGFGQPGGHESARQPPPGIGPDPADGDAAHPRMGRRGRGRGFGQPGDRFQRRR